MEVIQNGIIKKKYGSSCFLWNKYMEMCK